MHLIEALQQSQRNLLKPVSTPGIAIPLTSPAAGTPQDFAVRLPKLGRRLRALLTSVMLYNKYLITFQYLELFLCSSKASVLNPFLLYSYSFICHS